MNLFCVLVIVLDDGANFRVKSISVYVLHFFSESATDEMKNRGICCTIMHKLYQVYGKKLLSCQQSWAGEKRHFQKQAGFYSRNERHRSLYVGI